MKGTNYLAGFGTVFLFLGYYCFKAAFKNKFSSHSSNIKVSNKTILIVGGILSLSLGIFLIVKAISNIQNH